jgi:photosystem II stability/assembly factor-like uncharacterized protein
MNPLASPPGRRVLFVLVLLGLGLLLPPVSGQDKQKATDQDKQSQPKGKGDGDESKFVGTLPENVVRTFNWRGVGPANMGGRVTALSVYEADPSCYWVATAGGGLLHTTNNGVTFEHQFDHETTVSIGDVCVAPSDKNIVWVGSGEGLPRNSVSYGDGVYKSTDGGKTWKNMGLKETFQIGKILIHPKDPDIVYVGALGRLYGPNKERGLYKTTDGGKSWKQILYKDENTGIIDMVMHPTDPDTILIATWQRKRDAYDVHLGKDLPDVYDRYDPVVRFGPHGGIYRTTDGGKTFTKASEGLPTSPMGRVGLDWYRKDPNVCFAIVDCEDIGKGPAPKKKAGGGRPFTGIIGEDTDKGYQITMVLEDSPAAKADLRVGDIITGIGEKTFKSGDEYRADIAERSVGDKLKLQLLRDGEKKQVEITLADLPQGFGGGGGGGGFGGKDVKKDRPYWGGLGGQVANRQDEQGPDGYKYGGVYRSDDGGVSWKRINSYNPRPMYFSVVRVDPTDDKNLYVLGVSQAKSTDGGKTFNQTAGKGVHADGHALWIDPKDGRHMLIGCDGGYYVSYDRAANWDHLNTAAIGQFYHVAVDTKKPYWIYGGLQDNGSWGVPSVGLHGHGPINEDVISVGGGDGFVCRVDPTDPYLVYSESQDGNMSRRNLKTGERGVIKPKQEGPKGTPSPYRWNWNTPFILSSHNPKIFYCAGNYVFKSLNRGDDLKIISPEITLLKVGSATALSESPKNADVLWVGTDDGALWVTKNGGKDWQEISNLVPMPGPRCVATLEASRYKEGRCYVCFDGHRSDDDQPLIFVTEDYGQSWAPLRTNLPGFGSTRCLREDLENENLLFCGTEFAIFASINRGASWSKINNNLPTVAVHEVAIHPTAGEIAIATHGRSIWILDVSALRQMKPSTFTEHVHLFKPPTTIRWQALEQFGGTNRRFVGTNPPPAAPIYYTLAEEAKKVTIKIVDPVEGDVISTFSASTKAGLNRALWDMNRQGKGGGKGGKGGGKGGGAGGGGGGGGGKGGFGGGFGAARLPAGVYRVVLDVDGQELTTTVRIENDPNVPQRSGPGEEEELFLDPRRIQ